MHERHAGARKPVLNCLYHGLEEDGDTGDRVGNSRRNSEDPVVYCGQDVLSHLTCLVSNNQVGGRAEQDEVSGQSAHPRDEHPVVTGGSQVSHGSRDVTLDQKNERHVGDDVREQDDHNSEEGSAVVGWVGSAAGKRGPEEVVGVTGLHTSRDHDEKTSEKNKQRPVNTQKELLRVLVDKVLVRALGLGARGDDGSGAHEENTEGNGDSGNIDADEESDNHNDDTNNEEQLVGVRGFGGVLAGLLLSLGQDGSFVLLGLAGLVASNESESLAVPDEKHKPVDSPG